MARQAGWRFGLGVALLGSTLAIGGCADSMSSGSSMSDKGMQPAADKGMMGSGQGMTKDGAMKGDQGNMEKK